MTYNNTDVGVLKSKCVNTVTFSHRRPLKAQTSLRMRTVSPEHSLLVHKVQMQNSMKKFTKAKFKKKIAAVSPGNGRPIFILMHFSTVTPKER